MHDILHLQPVWTALQLDELTLRNTPTDCSNWGNWVQKDTLKDSGETVNSLHCSLRSVQFRELKYYKDHWFLKQAMYRNFRYIYPLQYNHE